MILSAFSMVRISGLRGSLALCLQAGLLWSVTGERAAAMASGGFQVTYDRLNGSGLAPSIREFEVGGVSLRAWQQLSVRRWRLRAELGRTLSLTRLRYVEGKDELAFEPPAAVTSLSFQVSPPWHVVTLGAGAHVPDAHGGKPGAFMNVWLQPVRVLGLGLEASRSPTWPARGIASFQGEGGSVVINSHSTSTGWRTAFTPSGSWRVTGQLWQQQIESGEELDDALAEFSLKPSGLLLLRNFEVVKSIQSGQLQFGLMHSSGDFTGRLHGYTEGLRFGQLGILEATWQSWQLRASDGSGQSSWAGRISGGRTEVYAAGVVKFWPFSDGLVELLGMRRHLELSGTVDWWHAGGSAARSFGRFVRLDIGVDWYRLYPDLSLFSWQPLLFGVGVSDPKMERFDVRRLDLGAAAIGGRLNLASTLEIHASVKQWIPLGLEKSESKHTPSGESMPSASSAESSASRRHQIGEGMSISVGMSLSW